MFKDEAASAKVASRAVPYRPDRSRTTGPEDGYNTVEVLLWQRLVIGGAMPAGGTSLLIAPPVIRWAMAEKA